MNETYDASTWWRRTFGLQRTAAGTWKARFLLRVSLFLASALEKSENLTKKDLLNEPAKRPQHLVHSVLATVLTGTWNLDQERRLRIVVSMKSDPFPVVSALAVILEFGRELLNPHEVLIRVFILYMMSTSSPTFSRQRLPQCTGQALQSRRLCYTGIQRDNG